jgi:predicted site-specific integrase-resolvase
MTKSKQNIDYSTITYARVPSRRNKSELEKQVNFLNKLYPNAEHIQEYASGLNYNRLGFLYIIQKIEQNKIKQIIALSDDIFLQINFNQFEKLCKRHNCKIIVYNKNKSLINIIKPLSLFFNKIL